MPCRAKQELFKLLRSNLNEHSDIQIILLEDQFLIKAM
jgi:hypothetical protein